MGHSCVAMMMLLKTMKPHEYDHQYRNYFHHHVADVVVNMECGAVTDYFSAAVSLEYYHRAAGPEYYHRTPQVVVQSPLAPSLSPVSSAARQLATASLFPVA